MGTRSKLIIKRFTKKDIHLWMHWDGYFDGVGNWLVAEIATLLKKYTPEYIQTLLESLDIIDIVDGQDFQVKDLIPFIEGKTTYGNDECDDIEFLYKLNFVEQTFIGSDTADDIRALSFAQIKTGTNMSDMDPDDIREKTIESLRNPQSIRSADMVIAMFQMLNDEDKKYVLSNIT